MALDNKNFQDFLRDLTARNDLVSVASRYVNVIRRGRYHWCVCPFHGDKNPSLCMSDDEMFYCFGCHAGGNVIKFVMMIESIEFMDAVRLLASWANMEVPNFGSGKYNSEEIEARKKRKDRLTALMKDTALFYHANLKKPTAAVAHEYMKKRQITDNIAKHFGIGYSEGYDQLPMYLMDKGYTVEEMVASGACKQKDGKQRPYDALAGRLIFPIIDIYGNVIAFGGRTLEAKVDFAKYLNTAETELFNKKNTLYAINYLKKQRQHGPIPYVIIVEGYMDTISLHKAGFTMAVASMGTALTEFQAKLIKRFADKVYICYDGDAAGHNATLRGLNILKDNGLDVMVVALPDKFDPDDVIKTYGREGYQKLLDEALPLVEFKLENLKNKFDLKSTDGRVKYLNEAITILSCVKDNVERELYTPMVSKIAMTNIDFLRRQLEAKLDGKLDENEVEKHFKAVKTTPVSEEEHETNPLVSKAEKYILYSLIHKKPYAFFKNNVEFLFSGKHVEIYRQIKQALEQDYATNLISYLYNYFSDKSDEDATIDGSMIANIINYGARSIEDESSEKRYYDDCLWIVYKNYLEKSMKELTNEYSATVDEVKRNEIKEQIAALSQKLKNKKVDEL